MNHTTQRFSERRQNLRARIWVTAAVALGLTVVPSSLLALDPNKTIFQFNCQNWTRMASLPADKIGTITQTPDGYIWLGGQNGLIRFDGTDFKSVPIKLPGAQGQDIQVLRPDRKGRLIFSIMAGGYGQFDGTAFSPIGDARWSAPGLNANTILSAKDGSIWTGSALGWGRWSEQHPSVSVFNQKPDRVNSFMEEAGGRMWIGTMQEGLFYWENDALHAFADEELKQYNVWDVARQSTGEFWVATDRGLYAYDAQLHRKEIFFPGRTIHALLVDRHGVLWVGSDIGLGRFQNGTFTFLHKADGLGSDVITSLFEDAEGSLWVGTVEGLSQLTDLKFPNFSAKEGIVPGSVLEVVSSRKGGLWITAPTGFSYFDGRSATNYVDPAIFANLYIRRIFEAKNGDVYFSDSLKDVYRLVEGRPVLIGRADQWPEAFGEDSAGILLAIGATLNRIVGDRIVPYQFEAGAPPLDWFTNLSITKDNVIWAGTHGGLYRIKEGQARRWQTSDGLPSDRVHCLVQDSDGGIWGGTPNGLFRIKEDRITRIGADDGLSDGRIYAMAPDDQGNLWMASGQGILRVSRVNLTDFADGKISRVHCESYNGLESLKFIDRTDQGYSACKTTDGRIWFPNPRGVVMIDPGHYVTNTVPPKVRIERIRANSQDVTGPNSPLLKSGNPSMEFQFSALSYIAPKKIHIRYQMVGSDTSWVDAGARRSVAYNNLPSGHYTFLVQAANADGVWNTEGDRFAFELPKPFYRRPWFYALGILAGTGGLIGLHRWNVKHLKAEKAKLKQANDALEQRVSERTAELAYERDLLRTLLDRSPDEIYFKDKKGRFIKSSNAQVQAFGVNSPDEIVGKTDFDFQPSDHATAAFAEEQEIMRTGQPLVGKLEKIEYPDGKVRWLLASKMPLLNKANEIIGMFGISKDVTVLKEAEARLIEVHKQLLETSRQAGMAEVATSVLHNVGNVLNSVNVSATLVSDQMRSSKAQNVSRVADLLTANASDLAAFLTNDPKGRKIGSYLTSLGSELSAEHQRMTEELNHLRKNIEHIKEVVAMQQSFAKVSGVSERIAFTELVEDAVRINETALVRHHIAVVRDFRAKPQLTVERHKVMQILVNLISNAKYACSAGPAEEKKIILRLSENGARLVFEVIDNGVGIPPENLTRIFAHGFTTKKDGHGFGLHSGALAARELGGTLVAKSDGAGRGATFMLELPLEGGSSTL
jgi:PAS domain S-box-containing protein